MKYLSIIYFIVSLLMFSSCKTVDSAETPVNNIEIPSGTVETFTGKVHFFPSGPSALVGFVDLDGRRFIMRNSSVLTETELSSLAGYLFEFTVIYDEEREYFRQYRARGVTLIGWKIIGNENANNTGSIENITGRVYLRGFIDRSYYIEDLHGNSYMLTPFTWTIRNELWQLRGQLIELAVIIREGSYGKVIIPIELKALEGESDIDVRYSNIESPDPDAIAAIIGWVYGYTDRTSNYLAVMDINNTGYIINPRSETGELEQLKGQGRLIEFNIIHEKNQDIDINIFGGRIITLVEWKLLW